MSKLKVHGNVHQSKTFTENVMMNKTKIKTQARREAKKNKSREKAISSLKSYLMSCETEMLIKKLSTTYLANG